MSGCFLTQIDNTYYNVREISESITVWSFRQRTHWHFVTFKWFIALENELSYKIFLSFFLQVTFNWWISCETTMEKNNTRTTTKTLRNVPRSNLVVNNGQIPKNPMKFPSYYQRRENNWLWAEYLHNYISHLRPPPMWKSKSEMVTKFSFFFRSFLYLFLLKDWY